MQTVTRVASRARATGAKRHCRTPNIATAPPPHAHAAAAGASAARAVVDTTAVAIMASTSARAPVPTTIARCTGLVARRDQVPINRLRHGGAPKRTAAAAIAARPAANTNTPTPCRAFHILPSATALATTGAVHTTREGRLRTTSW
jgi:hypothetical protein